MHARWLVLTLWLLQGCTPASPGLSPAVRADIEALARSLCQMGSGQASGDAVPDETAPAVPGTPEPEADGPDDPGGN